MSLTHISWSGLMLLGLVGDFVRAGRYVVTPNTSVSDTVGPLKPVYTAQSSTECVVDCHNTVRCEAVSVRINQHGYACTLYDALYEENRVSDSSTNIYSATSNPVEVSTCSPVPAQFCDEEFYEYEDRVFWLPSDTMSWTDAQGTCQAKSSHLADVTSQEEQNFISTITSAQLRAVWLGGANAESQGWVWQHSGALLTYTSWSSGATFAQNCMQGTISSNWLDQDCDRLLQPLCEYP